MTNNILGSQTITIHPSLADLKLSLRKEGSESPVLGKSHVLYENFINLLARDLPERCNIPSKTEKQLIMEKILMNDTSKNKEINYSVFGLAQILIPLTEEISESGITSQDMQFAAQSSISNTKKKFEQLADIMNLYTAELNKYGYTDETNKKNKIIEMLQTGYVFTSLRNTHTIIFKHIYNLSEIDFRLIYELSNTIKIKVLLPYDPYRQDAFRFLENTIRKFEYLGEHAPNLTLEFGDTIAGSITNHKTFLQNNLFKDETVLFRLEKYKNDSSVAVYKESNEYSALKKMCAKAKKLIAQGVKPENIAFVFKNQNKSRNYLAKIAGDYGVPIEFSSGTPLGDLPSSQMLFETFRFISDGFDAVGLIDFLASPYIDLNSLYHCGLQTKENDQTISLSRMKMEKLASQVPLIDDETEKLETALQRFLNRTFELPEKLTEQKKQLLSDAEVLCQIIKNLRERLIQLSEFTVNGKKAPSLSYDAFFRSLGLYNKMTAIKLENEDSLKILHENLSVYERFLKTAENVRNSILKIKTGAIYETFLSLLKEALQSEILPPATNTGGIKVLNFSEIPGMSFQYVLAGGLCDGEFPSITYENILLSDEEKKYLISLLERKLPHSKETEKRNGLIESKNQEILEDIIKRGPFKSRAMSYWEESYLFLCTFAACEKKIYLFSHYENMEGRAQLPSYFLEQAERISKFPDTSSDEILIKPLPLSKQEMIECILLDDNSPEYEIWKKYIAEHPEIQNELNYLNTLAESGPLCNQLPEAFAGKINGKKNLSYTSEKGSTDLKAFSATSLETYLHCPFAYFSKYILKCEKTPQISRILEPMVIGTIMHSILETYYRNKASGIETDAEKLVDEILIETEANENTGDTRLWRAEKKKFKTIIKNWLDSITENDSYYTPIFFEYKFGAGSGALFYRDLHINDNKERVYFQGSIDRIDISKDSIKIIDYKNSSNLELYKKKAKYSGEKAVQLPLYMAAAAELLKKEYPKHILNIFAGYALLPLGKLVPAILEDENENFFSYIEPKKLIDSETKSLDSDLSMIVNQIRNGNFSPSGEDCDWCEFSDICRHKNIQTGEDEGE